MIDSATRSGAEAPALRRRRTSRAGPRKARGAGSALRSGLLFVALVQAGCADHAVTRLDYELRRTLPHDPDAYTQGLLIDGGTFYESTGQYGESELRQVDIATGSVLRSHALSEEYFGEGLALVGDKLIQLTWKAGLAFVYDAATLVQEKTFEYDGEGWGICYDGEWLFMSDGTGDLFRRDPETFDLVDRIRVTRDGFSTRNLNELECVGDQIYANIYQSDEIVRIDKATGEITGTLDAYSLTLASRRPQDAGAVLNGIAFDASTGVFYVTGKLWPTMFVVAITEE